MNAMSEVWLEREEREGLHERDGLQELLVPSTRCPLRALLMIQIQLAQHDRLRVW